MFLINWWRERKRRESRREATKLAAAIAFGLASTDDTADPAICAMLKTIAETGFRPPELFERESEQGSTALAVLR